MRARRARVRCALKGLASKGTSRARSSSRRRAASCSSSGAAAMPSHSVASVARPNFPRPSLRSGTGGRAGAGGFQRVGRGSELRFVDVAEEGEREVVGVALQEAPLHRRAPPAGERGRVVSEVGRQVERDERPHGELLIPCRAASCARARESGDRAARDRRFYTACITRTVIPASSPVG